ncbi:MAG: YjcQ family protein [Bacteroidaceae bacterium]|nr:YjcQ family protein [Bacteroidaceae bacterium]
MDNFKAVYKILTALEKAMDLPEFDITQEINHETLKISEERYARYIEMMLDVGYVKGAVVKKNINGDTIIDADNIRITLKGLEYLQENSVMRQIYNAARGIKEIIPGA